MDGSEASSITRWKSESADFVVYFVSIRLPTAFASSVLFVVVCLAFQRRVRCVSYHEGAVDNMRAFIFMVGCAKMRGLCFPLLCQKRVDTRHLGFIGRSHKQVRLYQDPNKTTTNARALPPDFSRCFRTQDTKCFSRTAVFSTYCFLSFFTPYSKNCMQF